MYNIYSLNEIQSRILGVLIEKSLTSPDHYPVNLKALQAGCNQRTNRLPLLQLNRDSITHALQPMLENALIDSPDGGHSFRHRLMHSPGFNKAELSILNVLLLRGPHSPSDLLERTERQFSFAGRDHIERTLLRLANHEQYPCVVRLEMRSNDREHHWIHTFCHKPGMPATQPELIPDMHLIPPVPTPAQQRIKELEQRVSELEAIVSELSSSPLEPSGNP